jgi:hypothetical protein
MRSAEQMASGSVGARQRAELAELADWVEGLRAAAKRARDDGNLALAEALDVTRFEVDGGYLSTKSCTNKVNQAGDQDLRAFSTMTVSSVRQAAAVCNVSPSVIRRWLSPGLIPGPPPVTLDQRSLSGSAAGPRLLRDMGRRRDRVLESCAPSTRRVTEGDSPASW